MKRLHLLAASVAAGVITAGCSTTPTSVSARTDLHSNVDQAMARLYNQDPSLRDFVHNSDGYVIFPEAGKGGVGIGGAYGHGEVYDHDRFVGYADISQATVGAQLGGQAFMELIAFESPGALQRFESGQLTFDANASAVALKSGAAAEAKYTNGVAIFVQPTSGLMFEAAIGGQSFSFQPADQRAGEPSGLAGADETP